MPYRVSYYGFTCTCGAKPSGVRVGISSLCELTVEWICNVCKANCLVRKPLEEVVADAPAHTGHLMNEQDLVLLKEMHIAI